MTPSVHLSFCAVRGSLTTEVERTEDDCVYRTLYESLSGAEGCVFHRHNDRPNNRGEAIRRFQRHIDMDFAGKRDACTSLWAITAPKIAKHFTGNDTRGIPYAANGH